MITKEILEQISTFDPLKAVPDYNNGKSALELVEEANRKF